MSLVKKATYSPLNCFGAFITNQKVMLCGSISRIFNATSCDYCKCTETFKIR